MTTPMFTAEGLDIRTLTEIVEELRTGYRAIYGNDINLDDDTPDGQRIGIEGKAIADIEEFLLNLYNQMDADLAFGEWLNKLAKFSGIQRRPATRSTVEIEITTDRVLTLFENYTVRDSLGQDWIVTADVPLALGLNTVSFVALNFGAMEADPNTITEQGDVIIGIVDVNNPAAAVAGIDEESDEDFRLRRSRSTENPAFSTIGSLFARVGDLAGVTDVVVEENNSDLQDTVRDITPHTIWVIVEGGLSTDIVETIAKNRTAGVRTQGDENGVYVETLTRPNGADFIINHEINFDRPDVVDLHVTVTATRTIAGNPVDVDALKASIASRTFLIQENVMASQLYASGYAAGENFTLTDLLISDDNVTFTDQDINSNFGAKFQILEANITVNEVI